VTVAAEAAFQRAAVEAAGAAIARRAAEIEEDLQTVERELLETNDEVDRLVSEHTAAAAARIHAIESGRFDLAPLRVPSLATLLFWRGCELAIVVGEWIAFFFALANMNGVDPTNLEAEWTAGGAWAIVGSALAALTIAGGAFILAEWASARLQAVATDQTKPGRTFQLWTVSLAITFVAVVLLTVAVMRAQLGTAGRTSFVVFACYAILVAVPLLAGVCVHARADELEERRAAGRTLVGTPDRHDVASDLRKADEDARIAERERLRTQRSESIAALQRLNASVFGGDQALRDISRNETMVVSIWLDTLTAAIACDQAAFRLSARLLKREQLLARPLSPPAALVPMRRARRTA
jgi:hypothetical protein